MKLVGQDQTHRTFYCLTLRMSNSVLHLSPGPPGPRGCKERAETLGPQHRLHLVFDGGVPYIKPSEVCKNQLLCCLVTAFLSQGHISFIGGVTPEKSPKVSFLDPREAVQSPEGKWQILGKPLCS